MNLTEEQEKLEAKVTELENVLILSKKAGKNYAKEVLASRSLEEKEELKLRLRERLGNDPAELDRLTRKAEKEGFNKQEAVIKALTLDWQPYREGDPEDHLNELLDQGMPAAEAWRVIRLEQPNYYNKLRGDQE